jgi:hypothetical protein
MTTLISQFVKNQILIFLICGIVCFAVTVIGQFLLSLFGQQNFETVPVWGFITAICFGPELIASLLNLIGKIIANEKN